MGEIWPPMTEPAYDNPNMAAMKPGNFFTIANEDHPAYDLFRALEAQGWEWEKPKGGRHWLTMTHGDRFITFSLFGQGCFSAGSFFEHSVIGLEDYDNVWSEALPHIARFMRINSDQRADMFRRARDLWTTTTAASGREDDDA